MNIPHLRVRLWTLASLALLTPVGFSTKFYTGPGRNWVQNSLGGVLYEIFWILLVFCAFPSRKSLIRIAVSVCLITSALEVLQLWHPQFLQAVRATFLGSVLLGTTFVWSDFVYYAIGCLLGWTWARALCVRENEKP